MTRQLEGTFKTVSWDEKQYDAAEGQPKFTHARVVHELGGAISGEISLCYLMVYRPDQSAHFVGLGTITGLIDSREGSFVVQDVGTFENGVARGRWTIIGGLGSGDLREIRGEGLFAADQQSASYRLDVTL
jgi:hypothetical protein